jgi:hypothetical protein
LADRIWWYISVSPLCVLHWCLSLVLTFCPFSLWEQWTGVRAFVEIAWSCAFNRFSVCSVLPLWMILWLRERRKSCRVSLISRIVVTRVRIVCGVIALSLHSKWWVLILRLKLVALKFLRSGVIGGFCLLCFDISCLHPVQHSLHIFSHFHDFVIQTFFHFVISFCLLCCGWCRQFRDV